LGKRRQARENALHALYLADLAPKNIEDAFNQATSRSEADKATTAFAKELFENTLLNCDKIDASIQSVAANWSLARMATVDRNILRLAAYELIYRGDTPVKVIIDEAIEIARRFSTEDSTRFINGILDKLKDLRKDSPETK